MAKYNSIYDICHKSCRVRELPGCATDDSVKIKLYNECYEKFYKKIEMTENSHKLKVFSA